MDYSTDHKVFVYGTEVDDFLSVNKDQFGMLATAGVKELHKIIKEQQADLATTQTTLATTQAKLDALTQQTASLLAWAQTQGYSA